MGLLRRVVTVAAALVAALLVAMATPVVAPVSAAIGAPAARTQLAPAVDPPVTPRADPYMSVDELTVSRTSVAVSGVATVPVTVTVKAHSNGPSMQVLSLLWHHEPDSSQTGNPVIPLLRLAGTPTDGTWRGVLHVGSVHNGTLRPDEIVADYCYVCGWPDDAIPVEGPAISVAGSHIPRISLTLRPNPVALSASSVSLRAGVLDSQTGRPYRSPVAVWFGYDSVCAEGGANHRRMTVDGVATLRIDTRRDKAMLGLHCVFLNGPERDSEGSVVTLASVGEFFHVTTTLTSTPSAWSVRAGRPLVVRGRVAGANDRTFIEVTVQRLVGRSQWRELTTVPQSNGAYKATIRPSTRGTLTLRATLVHQGVRGTSTPVTVTVR